MATEEVFISWKSWNIYKKYNKICTSYAQIYALLHIFQSLMGPTGIFTGVILDPWALRVLNRYFRLVSK